MADRLTSLFEEDLQLQDELDEMFGDMAGENEEILICAMEDRVLPEDEKVHLFTEQKEEVNDDGLTEDEEREIAVALMGKPDSEIEDLLDDDMDDV